MASELKTESPYTKLAIYDLTMDFLSVIQMVPTIWITDNNMSIIWMISLFEGLLVRFLVYLAASWEAVV